MYVQFTSCVYGVTANYFSKKLHHKFLVMFWIRLWAIKSKIRFSNLEKSRTVFTVLRFHFSVILVPQVKTFTYFHKRHFGTCFPHCWHISVKVKSVNLIGAKRFLYLSRVLVNFRMLEKWFCLFSFEKRKSVLHFLTDFILSTQILMCPKRYTAVKIKLKYHVPLYTS